MRDPLGPDRDDRLRRRDRLRHRLLVAAFQQAGNDLRTAVLKQGLLSDPIDKTFEFFIVFVLLQTLSRRYVARFPQGEQAIGLGGRVGANRRPGSSVPAP